MTMSKPRNDTRSLLAYKLPGSYAVARFEKLVSLGRVYRPTGVLYGVLQRHFKFMHLATKPSGLLRFRQ
jgi:hypothetical protein